MLDDDEFEDHVREMDWDDEVNIYDTEETKSSLRREKSKLAKEGEVKSPLAGKFADIMAKPASPQVKKPVLN